MSGRKRMSKWDLPQSPGEHENSRLSFHNGGSDQYTSGISGSNITKSSFVESNDKHYPLKKSFSDSRFSERERDSIKSRDTMKDPDGDRNYSTRMSPGLEEWRKRSRSPRSRPRRSLRSRSRSWSRSRSRSRSWSRSRSPSNGFKHESGVNDRGRSRSRLSTQLCRDFLSGRCRRGDDCHFLHHSNRNFEEQRNPDDVSNNGYESRHRRDGNSNNFSNDAKEVPVREGRLVTDRDDNIRNRDSTFERGSWRDSSEVRRTSDIPCRFFAAGNCRNGEGCRFSHNTRESSSIDVKSRDDKWSNDHTSDYPDQRDPKRNHSGRGDFETRNEEKHRNQGASWNEERSINLDRPTRTEDRHRNQDGPMKTEDRLRNRDGPMRTEERDRNQDRPMRNEEIHRNHVGSARNDDKHRNEERPTWNEDRHQSYGVSESKCKVSPWPRTDRRDHNLDRNVILGGPASFDKAVAINGNDTFPLKLDDGDLSRGGKELKNTDNTCLGDMEMSPEWNYTVQAPNDTRKDKYGYVSWSSDSIKLGEASLPTSKDNIVPDVSGQMQHSDIVTKPNVLENPHVQQYPRFNNDVAFPLNSRNLTGKGSSSNSDINFSDNDLPVHNLYPNGQSSNVPSLHGTSAVVKSHPPFTTPSQGASQLSSELSTGQPSVSTEQLAQFTNLSASLAQQLPHLYAALNTAKAIEPQPSVHNSYEPVASGPTQPMTASALFSQNPIAQLIADKKSEMPLIDSAPLSVHNLYEPVAAGPTQPMTASALFSQNPIAQWIADKKSELPLIDSAPLYTTVGQTGGSFQVENDLGENHKIGIDQLNHSKLVTPSEIKKENEMVCEGKTVVPVSKKLGEDSPIDNMDEAGANEGKKSKEVKGLRAFKFALVECVKELLKPPWKEGKIDKDGYKIIVKKVSDKVTSTIQATSIPQTPEKIEQYLSLSKPKLTKLVQAYVEKHHKS